MTERTYEIFNTSQKIQHLGILRARKCLKYGAPGEIRTPDLLVRRPSLDHSQANDS